MLRKVVVLTLNGSISVLRLRLVLLGLLVLLLILGLGRVVWLLVLHGASVAGHHGNLRLSLLLLDHDHPGSSSSADAHQDTEHEDHREHIAYNGHCRASIVVAARVITDLLVAVVV